MTRPRLTAWRVTVAIIVFVALILLVWGLAFSFGDSSSDIEDALSMTIER